MQRQDTQQQPAASQAAVKLHTRAVIVMGVAGSGKTTLGQALASRLGWDFADADDFHPVSNREKMARGEALDDADRRPWLDTLHGLLAQAIQHKRPLVLACSALKEEYRQTLRGKLDAVQLVFASGSRELLAQRMRERQHFMPVTLLDSQLATLQAPAHAITADIRLPVEELVDLILEQLS